MLQNIILIGGNSMRKSIKNVESIFLMPVLMVATYNEDGSIDVKNGNKVDINLVDALAFDTYTHGYLQNVNFE